MFACIEVPILTRGATPDSRKGDAGAWRTNRAWRLSGQGVKATVGKADIRGVELGEVQVVNGRTELTGGTAVGALILAAIMLACIVSLIWIAVPHPDWFGGWRWKQ